EADQEQGERQGREGGGAQSRGAVWMLCVHRCSFSMACVGRLLMEAGEGAVGAVTAQVPQAITSPFQLAPTTKAPALLAPDSPASGPSPLPGFATKGNPIVPSSRATYTQRCPSSAVGFSGLPGH